MSKLVSSPESSLLSKYDLLWAWQKKLEKNLILSQKSSLQAQTEEYNRLLNNIQDAYSMGEITKYQAELLSFTTRLNFKTK